MILRRGQGQGQGAGCADDVKLHEHFLRSSLRTRDPDAATLFFVPVYLGRLFNWFWQRPHCDEEDAPEPPMCRSEKVPYLSLSPCRGQVATRRNLPVCVEHIQVYIPYDAWLCSACATEEPEQAHAAL